MKRLVLGMLLAAAAGSVPAEDAQPPGAAREVLQEYAEWRRLAPQRATQYDYTMTARVRLLLFWVGKDGVGRGFIRLRLDGGKTEEEFQSIEVLFGSDPEKAPRRINRWGTAAEVVHRRLRSTPGETSVFFGLMKTSRGNSAAEMQRELSTEAASGRHAFVSGLSLLAPQRAVMLKAPFFTEEDLDFRGAGRAAELALRSLDSPAASARVLTPDGPEACQRTRGFLFTVQELVEGALSGAAVPRALCFLHDSQTYTLTLESTKAVQGKVAGGDHGSSMPRQTSRSVGLVETHFTVRNAGTGKRTAFTLQVGTQGQLRGVPVEISFRPNWWFEVALHLQTSTTASSLAGVLDP